MTQSCRLFLSTILLVLTADLTAAVAPDQVAKRISHYVAANIDNGCVVESVLFADWFGREDFDGKATVMEFEATIPKGRISHAVAVYSISGRLYYWDVITGGGSLELVSASHPTDATIKEMVRTKFEGAYVEGYIRGQAGQNWSPVRKAPLDPSESVAQRAYRVLAAITRAKLLSVRYRGRAVEAVAFMHGDSFSVFVPKFGTMSGRFLSPPDEADLASAISINLKRLLRGDAEYQVERDSLAAPQISAVSAAASHPAP